MIQTMNSFYMTAVITTLFTCASCDMVMPTRNNIFDPKSDQFDALPEGTFVINSNTTTTNNCNVYLAINIKDCNEMRFGNSIIELDYSNWDNFQSKYTWTLSSGDGIKTVYGEFRDSTGNVIRCTDEIVLDSTGPQGSMAINNGDNSTFMAAITLNLNFPDATEMRFGNSLVALGNATWESYSSNKSWILTDGDGLKTVYAQLKDSIGNISEGSDTITRDYNQEIKNILCPPPYGIANPFFMCNRKYPIIAPKSFKLIIFNKWRFDVDGDGKFDTSWLTSNRYEFTYTTVGMKSIKAEASDGVNSILFNNNNLRIIKHATHYSFSEVAYGSLTNVYNGSIALGDIDNDGDLDLLLTGDAGSGGGGYKSILYLNDGLLGFNETGISSFVGVKSSMVALGDIDGDGDLDVIISGFTMTLIQITKIYRNNGDYTFSEIGSGSIIGVQAGSIALGDIDNDGDLDIIITGTSSTGRTTKLYLNDGSGVFSETGAGTLTSLSSSSIALGDIDNDGDLDILISGSSSTGNVTKIYQNNGGNFTEIGSGSITGASSASLALGDITGDDKLDLVITGYISSGTYLGKTYKNNGSGMFTDLGGILQVYSGSLKLGDFTSDGSLDLVQTGYNGSDQGKIYTNNGSGVLSDSTWFMYASEQTSIELGDLDGDNDLDILFTGYISGTGTRSTILRHDLQ